MADNGVNVGASGRIKYLIGQGPCFHSVANVGLLHLSTYSLWSKEMSFDILDMCAGSSYIILL